MAGSRITTSHCCCYRPKDKCSTAFALPIINRAILPVGIISPPHYSGNSLKKVESIEYLHHKRNISQFFCIFATDANEHYNASHI